MQFPNRLTLNFPKPIGAAGTNKGGPRPGLDAVCIEEDFTVTVQQIAKNSQSVGRVFALRHGELECEPRNRVFDNLLANNEPIALRFNSHGLAQRLRVKSDDYKLTPPEGDPYQINGTRECTQSDLFRLFHGGLSTPLCIGAIPHTIQTALDSRARLVYLSPGTAQKIRFHPTHPLPFACARFASYIVEHGHVMKQREGDLVFFAQIPHVSNSYLSLIGRLDGCDTGIWVRSMYKCEPRKIDAKLRRAVLLRYQIAEAAVPL